MAFQRIKLSIALCGVLAVLSTPAAEASDQFSLLEQALIDIEQQYQPAAGNAGSDLLDRFDSTSQNDAMIKDDLDEELTQIAAEIDILPNSIDIPPAVDRRTVTLDDGSTIEEVLIKENVTVTTDAQQDDVKVPYLKTDIQDPPFATAPKDRRVFVQDNQAFLGLSLGIYDAFTSNEDALSLGFEWQPGIQIAGRLKPIFGALATNEGSFFGYAGLGAPINVGKKWVLTPSAALGYYEDGDGVDLGQNLAYRFGAELSYVFKNQSRLGLNAHVITNGKSLGSDDSIDVIGLTYTTPIGYKPKPDAK